MALLYMTSTSAMHSTSDFYYSHFTFSLSPSLFLTFYKTCLFLFVFGMIKMIVSYSSDSSVAIALFKMPFCMIVITFNLSLSPTLYLSIECRC